MTAETLPPCPIFLTISPISRSPEESQIEINWGPNCPNAPEWIGLYTHDPAISNDPPIEFVETKGATNGNFKTNTKIGKLHLPNGWDQEEASTVAPKRENSKCLPFYIASHIGPILQTVDCLKIQPNWMALNQRLSDVPLRELFIPGTHCSGCFHTKSNVRSILLKKFGFVQNFDIWTQLVFGIRYLDISIG